METPEIATPAANQYTLGRLFRRAWTILFKEPRGKGRISRGESIMAGMVMGVITTIISVPLSWASLFLPVIVSIIGQLRSFGYLIRRAQDLGKTKNYVLIPFGALLILTALMGFLGAQVSPAMFMSGGWMWIIVGVLFLIFGIRVFVVAIKLLFFKGTAGDNAYGSDPLIHQPAGNGLYRGAWVGLLVVIILLSMLQKQPPQPSYADIMGEMQGQLPADMQAQMDGKSPTEIMAEIQQQMPDEMQAPMQDAIDQAVEAQEGSE